MRPADRFRVGDPLDGFQSGVFGRDSYYRRTVEAVGADWIVTRTDGGRAEFAEGSALQFLHPGEGSDAEPA